MDYKNCASRWSLTRCHELSRDDINNALEVEITDFKFLLEEKY